MATQRLPLKKCQPVRKLRSLELVITGCSDDTGKNTDKRVCNLVECQRLIRILRD